MRLGRVRGCSITSAFWVAFSGGSQLPHCVDISSPVQRPRGEEPRCQHRSLSCEPAPGKPAAHPSAKPLCRGPGSVEDAGLMLTTPCLISWPRES